MHIEAGDVIRVNVSAFTGARGASSEAIPCEVIEAGEHQLLIRTQPPCRVFEMWIAAHWVEAAEQLSVAGV